jgi:retron-type reverse transcriptase
MNAARLFNNAFRLENIQAVYDKHIAKTNAIGIDRINRTAFELKLSVELDIIRRKAVAGTYCFSQYFEKLISKGARRNPRIISIPTYRDRIVLRILCDVLRSSYSNDISQKIPQTVISQIKEALNSGKFNHFIKIDISDFYPSIDHTILNRALFRRIRKAEIIFLIENAITNPTVPVPDKSTQRCRVGVPQGLAISNILAEIYLIKFDEWLNKIPGIAFFRYVDDVLILCQSQPEHVFEKIKTEFTKSFRLTVHDLGGGSKSRLDNINEEFSFLGYQFQNRRANVRKESIARLEGSLAKIFTTYKYKSEAIKKNGNKDERLKQQKKSKAIFLWRLNLRITGCIYENTRKGWIFYFSQIDLQNLDQLIRLDKTIGKLIKRFRISVAPRDVKSFVRTFFEAKRKNGGDGRYIPNFDVATIQDKRKILAEYFNEENVDNFSDEKVERLFSWRIRRATRELENDIQDIS